MSNEGLDMCSITDFEKIISNCSEENGNSSFSKSDVLTSKIDSEANSFAFSDESTPNAEKPILENACRVSHLPHPNSRIFELGFNSKRSTK